MASLENIVPFPALKVVHKFGVAMQTLWERIAHRYYAYFSASAAHLSLHAIPICSEALSSTLSTKALEFILTSHTLSYMNSYSPAIRYM